MRLCTKLFHLKLPRIMTSNMINIQYSAKFRIFCLHFALTLSSNFLRRNSNANKGTYQERNNHLQELPSILTRG